MPSKFNKCQDGASFRLKMPADRPMRILQLTDMQTVDLTHIRNATRDRQIKGAYFKNGMYGMEERTYAHVRALVKEVAPDLILLTGDNVYGEFDDAGVMTRELIELMKALRSRGRPCSEITITRPVWGSIGNASNLKAPPIVCLQGET